MFKRIALALSSMLICSSVYANDVTGAGATFPFPLYAKWANDYQAETKVRINYQSIGSGAGIKQIQSKTVTFGASDMPLKAEDLSKFNFVQWPQTIGAIVMVVNIDGIQTNQLVLDGDTIANIYLGKIRSWNDAAITKLNPDVKLPAAAIAVVRRSDGSGTSFVFTNYLSKINAEWRSKVGQGTAVEWPVGVGARGNEGVAGNVAQTRNSIGFVEYAYAKQNRLTYTRLVNADQKTVTASIDSFAKAASFADWNSEPGFGVILTNQKGADSWPITAATFIIMYAEPANAANSREAVKFFDWAFEKGAASAESLDYVPIPKDVVEQIRQNVWSKIKH